MTDYLQHPLSAAFPPMSEDDFATLVDDIRQNGQRDAIVRFDDQILDGWHRYRACVQLNLEPVIVDFQGDDPRAFVLSRNLFRRHLTGSQRAAAVVAVHQWLTVGANQNTTGWTPGVHPPATAAAMAAAADVSVSTIKQAKVATKAGLCRLVAEGTLTTKRAVEIAKLPMSQREAAILDPEIKPKSGKRKARSSPVPSEPLPAVETTAAAAPTSGREDEASRAGEVTATSGNPEQSAVDHRRRVAEAVQIKRLVEEVSALKIQLREAKVTVDNQEKQINDLKRRIQVYEQMEASVGFLSAQADSVLADHRAEEAAATPPLEAIPCSSSYSLGLS